MAAARRGLAANAGKKFSSTAISPTKARTMKNPLDAPARITEGMLTLTLLEKKLTEVNPDFKQIAIPSPRPQLPIGPGADTVAVLAARNIKKVPKWAQPAAGQEDLAEKDAARLHKRSQARAVVDWVRQLRHSSHYPFPPCLIFFSALHCPPVRASHAPCMYACMQPLR